MNFLLANTLLTNSKKENYHKLANNTYLARDGAGNICVYLHRTPIITLHPDGSSTLDSGGYRTATTKERFGLIPCHVYQDKFDWYIGNGGKPVPFFDGARVDASGLVLNTPS